jgi:hypothetical protein
MKPDALANSRMTKAVIHTSETIASLSPVLDRYLLEFGNGRGVGGRQLLLNDLKLVCVRVANSDGSLTLAEARAYATVFGGIEGDSSLQKIARDIEYQPEVIPRLRTLDVLRRIDVASNTTHATAWTSVLLLVGRGEGCQCVQLDRLHRSGDARAVHDRNRYQGQLRRL